MFRTTINVTGDLAIAVVIDRSEGTFNEKMYYSENEIKLEDLP